MFGPGSIVLLVLLVVAVALLYSTAATVFAAVPRKRLERFALRQALVITTGNENEIIRYLATTRRWRGGLLALSIVGSVVASIVSRHTVHVSAVGAFAGWFVGAVIAEWRVDSVARGPVATASLLRRRLTDYVPRWVVGLVSLVWALASALVLARLVEAVAGRGSVLGALGLTLAALVGGGVLWVVAQRVLSRRQPLAAEDVLEADNAIRSRSLNVLAGSGLAIGGYLGAQAVAALGSTHVVAGIGGGAYLSVRFGGLFGDGVLPILGVVVATRPRLTPVRTRVRSRVA